MSVNEDERDADGARARNVDASASLTSTRSDTGDALGTAARRTSTPDEVGPGTAGPGTPLQRLFWFGILWLAGVMAVSLVAFLIRSVIS